MRIVVSGTHGSGKSTLISDFALRHPEFAVLPDPFEALDESWDAPGDAMFAAQLRIAADRLHDRDRGEHLIAERGPIDFLAYLLASAELTGRTIDDTVLERATEMTAAALAEADLLIVLPLTPVDSIHVDDEEGLRLRETMNDVLLELADDPDVTGGSLVVAEITGDPESRLAALETLAAVERTGSREH